eukprot:c19037_g1_i1.p1 GENE.c19037_g1_i1~~c19037_g1_i1.p1  ORF type:complete len:857 (+),score=165.52 c19037_g1_i1:45-2615(+)
MSVAPPLPSDYQVKTLVSLKDPSQPPPAPSQPHPINPQRRSLSALRERTTKLNSSPKATPSAPDMTIHTKDERPRSIGRSFAPKGRHSVSSRPNRSSGKFKGPEAEHDSGSSGEEHVHVIRENRRSVGSFLGSLGRSRKPTTIRTPTATPATNAPQVSSIQQRPIPNQPLRRRPEFAGEVNGKAPTPPMVAKTTAPPRRPSSRLRSLINGREHSHMSLEDPPVVDEEQTPPQEPKEKKPTRLSIGRLSLLGGMKHNNRTQPSPPTAPAPVPQATRMGMFKSLIGKDTKSTVRSSGASRITPQPGVLPRPGSLRVVSTTPPSRVVPRQNSVRQERPRTHTTTAPSRMLPQDSFGSNSTTNKPSQLASQLSGLSAISAESTGSAGRTRGIREPRSFQGYSQTLDEEVADELDGEAEELHHRKHHRSNNYHNLTAQPQRHNQTTNDSSNGRTTAEFEESSSRQRMSSYGESDDDRMARVAAPSDGDDIDSDEDVSITLRSAARVGASRPNKNNNNNAYIPKPLSPRNTIDLNKPTPTKLNHQETDTARQGNDYDYFLSTICRARRRAYFDVEANDISELFDLHQDVGEGGYSKVHRAIDKRTGEERAVKLVAIPTYLQHRTRMEAEAAVLGSVSHDSIVRFYGIVRTPKHFCFVMELLDGGELFEKIIEQQEGYPEPEACRLITTILEAVEHLHKHGVVHRDIKPENFLFDYRHSSEGVLKLIDFGFATFQNPHANMLGSSCGTPDYIAPELLLERPHNKAVDMWSVGVVLYTLLCSFPPFYAETDEELFDLIAAGTYDFPPPRWTKISADAKDLVSRLLQVDPAKRWTATQALGHPWIIRNNLLNAQRLFSARLNAAN